ncbi:hypothetical protein L2E82_15702 [Cichorium intybus]|uniref:Uncharacterized protein n=1 Tax=Cichorium intybus TaxID=13427 RepID=A0ACB9F3Z7_CICIN|nr:hypothetical protein L2E82_15702 [Cichorium intybus]
MGRLHCSCQIAANLKLKMARLHCSCQITANLSDHNPPAPLSSPSSNRFAVAVASILHSPCYHNPSNRFRWVKPDRKKEDNMAGEWNYISGKWNGDAKDKGYTFTHSFLKKILNSFKCLHVCPSETVKFGHVMFFWNGNRSISSILLFFLWIDSRLTNIGILLVLFTSSKASVTPEAK